MHANNGKNDKISNDVQQKKRRKKTPIKIRENDFNFMY